MEGERRRVAQPGREGRLVAPSASKRWIDAFTSGSTPMLPDEPTPTNSAPVFGSIARWRLAWPMDDAEHALLGDHLLADERGVGLRCSGGTSGAFCCAGAHAGRTAPSRCGTCQMPILVGDQHVAVAPGEPVRPVEPSAWRLRQSALPSPSSSRSNVR